MDKSAEATDSFTVSSMTTLPQEFLRSTMQETSKARLKEMLGKLGEAGLLVTSKENKMIDGQRLCVVRYQIRGDSYVAESRNLDLIEAKKIARENFANYVYHFQNEYSTFAKWELPPCHDPILKATIAHMGQEDYMAKFHGGWTLETTNKHFHRLLKELAPNHDLQPDIKYFGGANVVSYACEEKIRIRSDKGTRTITASGSGDCKEACLMDFRMTFIRQCYHLGYIKFCKEQTEIMKTERKEFEFEITTTPATIQKIQKVLALKKEERKADSSISSPPSNKRKQEIHWRLPNPPPGMNERLKLSDEKSQKNVTSKVLERREQLPIYRRKKEIVDLIQKKQIVVVQGSTGCGKSTQIPQFLLEDFVARGHGANFVALITQPRRICAQSLARRVAQERGETLDKKEANRSVGYARRFDVKPPRKYGSICYLTAGYLLRKMQSGLEEVSHVFIDEAHEMDKDIEILLTLARDMARKHPKLKIVVMSATINVASLQQYFDNCGFLQLQGNTAHPVESYYLKDVQRLLASAEMGNDKNESQNGSSRNHDEQLEANFDTFPELNEDMANLSLEHQIDERLPFKLIQKLVEYIDSHKEPGAILVFLPGWGEIKKLYTMLRDSNVLDQDYTKLLCLHSKLPKNQQRRVFEKDDDQRKIILSTNMAESSVTIEDVVYVIDSGLSRVARFSPATNTNYFCTINASKANCLQRKGRAGRCQEGKYYLMMPKEKYEEFQDFNESALLNTTLYNVYLKVKSLKFGSVEEFLAKTPSPPSSLRIVEARCKLQEIGALDEHDRLTALGELLAELPLEIDLGAALILSRLFGVHDHATELICNTQNAPWNLMIGKNTVDKIKELKSRFKSKTEPPSDHEVMKLVAEKFELMTRDEQQAFLKKYALDGGAMYAARRSKRQLLDIIDRHFQGKKDQSSPKASAALPLGILSRAFYPNTGVIDKESKKITTIAQDSPGINSISVVHTNRAAAEKICFFNEKTQSKKRVYGQEISVISPIQLLLFASGIVEKTNDGVLIGNTIRFKVKPQFADALLGLRKLLKDHLANMEFIPQEVSTLINQLLSIDLEKS